MSDKCDYSMEKYGDNYCAIKKEQVSYDQYQDFCKRDNRDSCPIIVSGRRTIDMEKKTCPYCGFWGHLVTKSGDVATYCCERCHKLFKVSI